jgi:hypothetical protein
MDFTEPQRIILSELSGRLRKLQDKVKEFEELESTKANSTVKTRARTSLNFHQRELEDLEKEFERKKQMHLEAIQAAKEALESESQVLSRARAQLRVAQNRYEEQKAIFCNLNSAQNPQPVSSTSSEISVAVEKPQAFSDPFGEWDISGMTPSEISEMLFNRQKRGETIPHHLLHYLRPSAPRELPELGGRTAEQRATPLLSARELPEAPSAPIIKPSVAPQPVIPSLSPPPPAKKQPRVPTSRQPLKQLGAGTVLYPRPSVDGDSSGTP